MIFALTRIFLTFFDRNIFPHFLAAIAYSTLYKWKLGNKNTVKRTLHYYRQFSFSLVGKRNQLHFL